jgi:hypothetical protein
MLSETDLQPEAAIVARVAMPAAHGARVIVA